MSDPTFWLFLSLGWGFAIVAILMSWWRVDHGLAEVLEARKGRDKFAKQVAALNNTLTVLHCEWPSVYTRGRNAALENIADGRMLMGLYERVVRSYSRHHDIQMMFPQMTLPQELESPEPPPLQIEAAAQEEELHR